MNLIYVAIIGIGATAATDVWGLIRERVLRVPAPNYGLVGRWMAHMVHGQFHHDAIQASPPIPGEQSIGWLAHYLIGIAYAAVLIGIAGLDWIQHPTLSPALIVGICTVAAPFLLMQPGMGAGIAASNTPRPNAVRLQSLLMHTVFGLSLYAAGCATHLLLIK